MKKYLFIGDIEKLKNVNCKNEELLRRLLEQCGRYKLERLEKTHPKKSTTYMGMASCNLAMAYLITGQDQYLIEAKRWIFTAVGYEKWGNAHLVNVDLSASFLLFGLSLSYNWLSDSFTKEEKELLEKKLILQADIMYKYKVDTEGKGWSTNYYQNHNWINMCGLAAAGYAVDYVDSQKWIDSSKENFDIVFDCLADDGSNYEGAVYWRYGSIWLFIYAHMLKVEGGKDHFKTSGYLKNTFFYRLYQAMPNLEETINYGDCHDRRSGHCSAIYYKTASEYKNQYAQKLGNEVQKFAYREQYESKVKPGILPEAFLELLWYDENVEEKDFSDLPLSRHFEDLGLVTIKDSWEKDGLIFSIKCGHPGGKKQWKKLWDLYDNKGYNCFGLSHYHPDNNSFIFGGYGSYFTIDDGYNRDIVTNNHNVMAVDGKTYPVEGVNDVMTSSAFKLKEENADFDPLDYIAEVTDFVADEGLTFFRGEASKVYDKDLNLAHWSRSVIFSQNEYFIIFDDVSSEDEHVYSFTMNTDNNYKKVDEETLDYDSGLAKMRLHSIYPKEKNIYNLTTYVKAVMTTQEPDNYTEIYMKTTKIDSEKTKKAKFLNLLVPKKYNEDFNYSVRRIENGLEIEKDGFVDCFIYKDSSDIEYRDIKTDGQMLFARYKDDKLVKIMQIGAKSISVSGICIDADKNVTIMEA